MIEEKYIDEIWEVPISTDKDFMSNKVDYRIYGGLMLNSNSDNDKYKRDNQGKRYIMGDRMDEVYKEISDSIINPKTNKPLSLRQVKEHIRRIRKLGAKQFSIETKDDKLYYSLQFGELNHYGRVKGGTYVTIPSDKLRILMNAYSSNSIKVYATLLWVCWDNKRKCLKESRMTYETFKGYLGIENDTVIHDCIWALEGKFIKIRKKRVLEQSIDKNGNLCTKPVDYNFYSIILD